MNIHKHVKLAPKGEQSGRRSIRLRDYDYSQVGAYFVTVCTDRRKLLFGEVVGDEVKLNELGRITAEAWLESAQVRSEIELDAWVVMPNHVHGIVIIKDNRRENDRPTAPGGPRPKSLGALVAGFKSTAAKRINATCDTPGAPVWQRNYYERIIRNETALNRSRKYIVDNPAQWDEKTEKHAIISRATSRPPLQRTRCTK